MTHDLEVWQYMSRRKRGLTLRDFVRLHRRRSSLYEHADEGGQDDKRRAREEREEKRER